MRYITVVFLFMLISVGCSHRHNETKIEKHETVKRTLWTGKLEVFVEYDEPKVGSEAIFVFYLTDLKNYKPIKEGKLNLEFIAESGDPVNIAINTPQKAGIYQARVTFKQKGHYKLMGNFIGKNYTEKFVFEDIDVIDNKEEHIHKEADTEDNSSSTILFQKEQQWAVDFMSALPEKKGIASTFVASGELIPPFNAEATISSPLSGIISLSKSLPYVGKKVVKGEVIAVIEPPVSQQGGIGQLNASYAEAKNKVVLAERGYERAKRLYEAKAIPLRRFEEAEIELKVAKANLEPLEKAYEEMRSKALDGSIAIKTPMNGTVAEVFVSNGKAVDAGHPIARVINTSTLWLKANVPASEIGRLRELNNARFRVEGIKNTFMPSKLVSVNDIVNPESRTVSVIFEVNNPGGVLKIGMFADVHIETGFIQNALTLPEESLFEDEGRFFVYVQKEGNLFERREVKTGIKGNGLVQIIGGINENERVVIKGGYYVKLASMSSRIPQGHGHEH